MLTSALFIECAMCIWFVFFFVIIWLEIEINDDNYVKTDNLCIAKQKKAAKRHQPMSPQYNNHKAFKKSSNWMDHVEM